MTPLPAIGSDSQTLVEPLVWSMQSLKKWRKKLVFVQFQAFFNGFRPCERVRSMRSLFEIHKTYNLVFILPKLHCHCFHQTGSDRFKIDESCSCKRNTCVVSYNSDSKIVCRLLCISTSKRMLRTRSHGQKPLKNAWNWTKTNFFLRFLAIACFTREAHVNAWRKMTENDPSTSDWEWLPNAGWTCEACNR